MADLVLECRDLRKSYGERLAVDGVGFRIEQGETYGLLGPNGAGKTTSISMVCGSGVGTIVPELGILLAYAAVLLVVAVNLFRRR